MKRERSLRRVDDEKAIIESKRVEIDSLNKEIESMYEGNRKLQDTIAHYRPHCELLTQVSSVECGFRRRNGVVRRSSIATIGFTRSKK